MDCNAFLYNRTFSHDCRLVFRPHPEQKVFIMTFPRGISRAIKCLRMDAPFAPVSPYGTPARGMATLKAISMRLKSVKNIQKITMSMKMVSAAKYARAEKQLTAARPIGDGARQFYDLVEVMATDSPKSKLIIAVTSDRGLCGAVHSQVSRGVRRALTTEGDASGASIVCIGDKSRSILQRQFGGNIAWVATEVGREPPTFQDASKIAAVACEIDFASGKIIYNKFNSVVSYTTSEMPLYSTDAVNKAPKLLMYEEADPEVVESYIEFSIAAMLFYAMKEAACSELSARMTAMDNASKNAKEMIDKLALTFNRTRQAVITRELIEIISGASAL